jgi:hypothetical protein
VQTLGSRLNAAIEARVRSGFDRFTQRLSAFLLNAASEGAPYVGFGFETSSPELHSRVLHDWLLQQGVDADKLRLVNYGLRGRALVIFLNADPSEGVTVTRFIRKGWVVTKTEKLE